MIQRCVRVVLSFGLDLKLRAWMYGAPSGGSVLHKGKDWGLSSKLIPLSPVYDISSMANAMHTPH